MTIPLIELKDISRHYKSGDIVVKALNSTNISIWHGDFVAIMGQSGSGKSTLMNIIGCLDKPTTGTYKIMGREVSKLESDDLAALRRDIFGFIFQRYNLLATASAEENVEIPGLYAGMKRVQRSQRARQLLDDLGLSDRYDHRPAELSGGQQQRVAIARALMNDPPVILADEPTGALDSHSGKEVMNQLKSLNEKGRTIILITHDEQVAAHAKRIIRIQDGKIIADSMDAQNGQFSVRSKDPVHHKASSLSTDSFEAIKTAFRSLRSNLFRTSLTLLGIVIGVASVITMLAVGNGSKQRVLTQISAMGTNILSVRPGAAGIRSSGDIATLVASDAKALEELSNVVVVVPERSGRKTLRIGNIDYASNIQGVGAGFPLARDWPIQQGTFFTIDDVNSYAAVIVLGATVAKTFFPGNDNPIGQFMLVGNTPFQIIGTMSSKGAAPWGGDQDDTAYIPYTTAMVRLFGSTYLNSITLKVEDASMIAKTEAEIVELLKNRHGTEDFSVRNTASFLEMATATQNTLTILLGAVAAISLLVGGIGVMNIMLVSVTERTREIGIRIATGARMRDIMVQFNTEAAVVCTIGGVFGVLLGFLAGIILSLFGVDIVFSLFPALLAFSCAVSTGLLFGYLPARTAAQLDPVVALSSE
ncbi:MacB family efflux pump subunit [Candidatus Berkiella cookevillensis]|uniref:Pyoverdine export ATP-binding/permease protein PvdT n=1 Tax=Candidatus Berkiella cookevillensis TaxID=437022 RepID=A0A0Q9YP32_9GAMM|nr:MacB family efflux pump subunit [Candidatus Berkiella cookevillensis]MCS5708976.1 MacB family efflux pump subunit [Candidatus Berkiella cookevillensis]